MTQTFTFLSENLQKKEKNKAVNRREGFEEPADQVIANILNYSKNLEVRASRLLKHFEILKS